MQRCLIITALMLHFSKWDQNPFVFQDIYLIVPSDTNRHGQHIPLAKNKQPQTFTPMHSVVTRYSFLNILKKLRCVFLVRDLIAKEELHLLKPISFMNF